MNERSLFLAALDLTDPGARAAFLDQACAGDAALRRRLDVLLQEHDRPGTLLAHPPLAEVTVDQQPLAECAGTVIGPYKLMEPIGEGGMGLVFVAEQTEPVRRKVALKVIKPGMDTRDVIARFEAERQALALMDHPNIAKILDAGTTASGRPYFVMELVKGVPVTDYCDQCQLTPRERIELFVNVCQAVQHAHTKGVIHRDLKPSNILIAPHDGKPVVKVIDFGVAKAIGQPLTDKTIYTRLTQMIGTPLYMSPEQAEINALDVDTRSDVYALAVLLYELLTGTTPFDRQRFGTAAFDEIRRIIREEEPPKPSTRLTTLGDAMAAVSAKRKTEPGQLSALVRGDLDWIVMKGLDKDRTRRYETASAFAADVRRYLSDEMVEARPPSAWYRFRKLARRNRAAMTTAALVAAALLLGMVGTVFGLVQAIDSKVDALAARDDEAQQRQEAVDQRKLAVTAAADARKSAQLAVENATRAEENAALALQNEQLFKEQAKIAQDNWNKAEWRLYASNITSAQREWETKNILMVNDFLNQCRPEFRGWEHDYLYTQANQNHKTLGHSSGVQCVAFSPDGQLLASVTQGPSAPKGEVWIWDAVTGQKRSFFRFSIESLRFGIATFSPDSKHLVIASTVGGSGRVVSLDIANDKVASSSPFNGGYGDLAFSPDGTRLAGPGGKAVSKVKDLRGKSVRMWDTASGKQIMNFVGHKEFVNCTAFSIDGKLLASASVDKTVKLWDVNDGKELKTLKGHRDWVTSVAFSPNGKWLAGGGGCDNLTSDFSVKLWDIAGGQVLQTFKGHTRSVTALAFSPNGKLVASASRDLTVKLWDTDTGDEIQTFNGHSREIKGLAFSPDGKRLASRASKDKTVKLWEVAGGEEVMALTVGAVNDPAHGRFAFSPDGQRVAGISGPGLRVWDAASGTEIMALGEFAGEKKKGTVIDAVFSPDGKRRFGFIAFSPDGNRLIHRMDGQPITLLNVATRDKILLQGHTGTVIDAVFSPDGKRLASWAVIHEKGTNSALEEWSELKLWDLVTVKELQTIKGGSFPVFSPDGRHLAFVFNEPVRQGGGGNGVVKVWDAESGNEVRTLKGHVGFVYNVAFSPDGKQLASVSRQVAGEKTSYAGKVWEVASGKEVHALKGAHTIDYSSDGKRLVFSSDSSMSITSPDGRKLWEAASGSGIRPGVVFSPDGKRLAAIIGRTVKLWDAATGQELLTFKNSKVRLGTGTVALNDLQLSDLAFSPDGKRLACVASNYPYPSGSFILIWDASMSMKEAGQE